tara:strand:- start:12 stop:890 length:879 start_codon:yes stop_codon:yes gene_type:complete
VSSGVFLINKKKFITSSKTLSIFKKRTKIKKAGIFGILDPLATGILPIVTGEASKFISYITNNNKTYIVRCKLGAFSECGDYESEPIIFENEYNTIKKLSKKNIVNTFKKFIGPYFQTPPMYSASKYRGKPLYIYARNNMIVERQQKERHIYDLQYNSLEKDILSFVVTCSPGTYIRTLVQDIAKEWSLHSCLYELDRSGVEPFEKYSHINVDDINTDNLEEYRIDIIHMLSNVPSIVCNHDEISRLYNGLHINKNNDANYTICKLMGDNTIFHGIGLFKSNVLYPKRLMKR